MTMDMVKESTGRLAVMAVLSLSFGVPMAFADTQPTYDRRIEEAAIRMLQPKLGDIRGSLDIHTETHLYPPLNRRIADQEVAAPALRGQADGSFIRY